MILQSLCQLYNSARIEGLAPYGFEYKAIPFIVVISETGKFVRFDDTRRIEGSRKVGASFLVPKAVKKTSGISANLLWDVAEYAVGLDKKGNLQKTQHQFDSFKGRMDPFSIADEVQVVQNFLAELSLSKLQASKCWSEIIESNCLLSFKLEGTDHLVCQNETFLKLYRETLEYCQDDKAFSPCLVTGQLSAPVLLHPAIKKLQRAQSSGANIVSFNLPAFVSWSKKQGMNAPISQRAAFEYTTVLNYMLNQDNGYGFRMGNQTFLFWSDRFCHLESVFKYFFVDAVSSKSNADTVDDTYAQVFLPEKDCSDTCFYVLGLSPNNARIAICLWSKTLVRNLLKNLSIWFDDLKIVGIEVFGRSSLERLLRTTCPQFKAKYLSDKLIIAVMHAVLSGDLLPHSLMTAVLSRIRADKGKINYNRASLLKAFINRKYRYEGSYDMQLTVTLDEENYQPGYVLGRLFSVLERLQEEAHRSNLSTTITSRYYGGASVRPQSVFNALFQLHIHHLRKLRNPGRVINFKKMIGDLVQKIGVIPAYLSSEQQCLFAVGYYHQRQSFYISHRESEVNNDEDADEFE